MDIFKMTQKEFEEYGVFEFSANKSLSDIGRLSAVYHQSIRNYFSRLLSKYTEEHPLVGLNIETNNGSIIAMCQSLSEGCLCFMSPGCTSWEDIDVLDTDTQMAVLGSLTAQYVTACKASDDVSYFVIEVTNDEEHPYSITEDNYSDALSTIDCNYCDAVKNLEKGFWDDIDIENLDYRTNMNYLKWIRDKRGNYMAWGIGTCPRQ